MKIVILMKLRVKFHVDLVLHYTQGISFFQLKDVKEVKIGTEAIVLFCFSIRRTC